MNNNFKIKKNGRTKKWMYMDNNYSFRNSLWRDHYFLILNLFLILFFIFLYILNQKYLKHYLDLCFFRYHFNDILAGGIIITYINLLFIFLRKSQYCLRRFWIIVCVNIVIGFFWEFITPFYRQDSITDVYDLIAYTSGGCLYYIIINVFNSKHMSI